MSKVNPTSRPRWLARLLLLGRCRPVFFSDVFEDVLALGAHARVQFERLEMDVGLDFAGDALQRLLQRFQADRAPGTRYIRHEINSHLLAHESPPSWNVCAADNAACMFIW